MSIYLSCRNASKKEIMKKYRKLAAEWHPDRFSTDEEKAKAEKEFLNIAAAKEVLTDPGMIRYFVPRCPFFQMLIKEQVEWSI